LASSDPFAVSDSLSCPCAHDGIFLLKPLAKDCSSGLLSQGQSPHEQGAPGLTETAPKI
jgi:hypothetical protein